LVRSNANNGSAVRCKHDLPAFGQLEPAHFFTIRALPQPSRAVVSRSSQRQVVGRECQRPNRTIMAAALNYFLSLGDVPQVNMRILVCPVAQRLAIWRSQNQGWRIFGSVPTASFLPSRSVVFANDALSPQNRHGSPAGGEETRFDGAFTHRWDAFLARRGVPDTDRSILPRRGYALAVRGKRDRLHDAAMTSELVQLLRRHQVPNVDGVFLIAEHQAV